MGIRLHEAEVWRARLGPRRPRRDGSAGGVTRLKVGDEVFGTGKGSFAEFCKAQEDKTRPQASQPQLRGAAAVPTSGQTPCRACAMWARCSPARECSSSAPAAGVGLFAVQVAKALGGQVKRRLQHRQSRVRQVARGGGSHRLHEGRLRPASRPLRRHHRYRWRSVPGSRFSRL